METRLTDAQVEMYGKKFRSLAWIYAVKKGYPVKRKNICWIPEGSSQCTPKAFAIPYAKFRRITLTEYIGLCLEEPEPKAEESNALSS